MSRRLLPRALAVVAAAALVLTTAAVVGSGSGAARPPSPSWLNRLNAARAGSGLDPVSESTDAMAAMKRHVTYLLRTPDRLRQGKYVNVHAENPASKYFSKSGARVAGRSEIDVRSAADLDVVEDFLAAPFEALKLLDPRATRAALYRDPASGKAMLEIDVDHDAPRPTGPVEYPNGRATQARMSEETPDPTRTCERDGMPEAALPIIVMLPATPEYATATLTRPDGSKQRNLCLVYDGQFRSHNKVYGPAAHAELAAYHAVLIIAQTPFHEGDYKVSLDYGADAPLTWRFHEHPSVQFPDLKKIGGLCGFTRGKRTGHVRLALWDTQDATPKATYRLRIGHQTKKVLLREGWEQPLRFARLSPGTHVVHVTGPVNFTKQVTVGACPVWKGVESGVPGWSVADQTATVWLYNRRNAGSVTFTVKDTGQRNARFRVRGGHARYAQVPAFVHKRTEIWIDVGPHLISADGWG